MCGIAGVIGAAPPRVQPAVRRMMRAMIHRGPDDEGYEERPLGTDGAGLRAGLGFRRLAILDLSPAGHQPMVNPATGDLIVFNGEIYNFRWLRQRLESAGVSFRSTGDTEVLLAALSTWGEAAFAELDGMFALAFYHAGSRRILLARDHVGIKPLYVGRAPGALVFASEIRAVLASGLVADDLSAAGVATFLAYGAPQDPLTVHRDVSSFPSGSYAWVDATAAQPATPLRARRYWRFPRVAAAHSAAGAAETVRFQIDNAVRDQSVADVPLGLFLSGGIDSATLAAFARKRLPDVRTHAVGFESERAVDEIQAAAETAAAVGTTHAETIVTDATVADRWHQWLAALDRPSIDGLNTFIVSRAVRDGGMTVALSGLGADELFGGYPQFRSVPRMARTLAPLAVLPDRLREAAASVAFAPLRTFRRSRAIDLVSHASSPLDVLLRIRRISTDRELAALGLRAHELGLCREYLPAEEYLAIAEAGDRDVFHTIAHAECALYMGNTTLRDSDTNGMAHSLEVRVPYLARSLVDYVGSIPGAMHMPAAGQAKHLLRAAGRGLLPEDVYRRPKTGFSLPIGEWMFGRLRESCEAAVEAAAACPLLDGGGVREIWRFFTAHRQLTDLWFRPLAIVALGSYLGGMGTSAAAAAGDG
jgi:asparagine synthase (glutamine-hydrolysing)